MCVKFLSIILIAAQVFVVALSASAIERVSVATDGTQGDGTSYSPSISADGRIVAFESIATNLVLGRTSP